MNKVVVLGIFAAIFVAGLGVIISSEHISFNELVRSLSHLNPRVLSLIALPFIAGLVVLVIHLGKKREERMWKKAVLKTRAKK